MPSPVYRGRFAPSPTGSLHFGSLLAAVGSFLQARASNGSWLVRVEDLDPPREVPGAATDILHTLDAFGMHPDADVLFQSTRANAYLTRIDSLLKRQLAYYCTCTRSDVAAAGIDGEHGPVYPGTCRDRAIPAGITSAIRVRTHNTPISFDDRLFGVQSQRLEDDVGDFIVRRADGLTAYQLAVVVDDHYQQITEVVRGADLLDSTTRQIHLQQVLGMPTPDYLHLPLVVDAAGKKLSKQAQATPVDAARPAPALCRALACLGLPPPQELQHATPDAIWRWAIPRWRPTLIPGQRTIRIEDGP